MELVWDGLFYSPCGYAEAARGYVMALDAHGIKVRIEARDRPVEGAPLPAHVDQALSRMRETVVSPHAPWIQHVPPHSFRRIPGPAGRSNIGCTVFETDRLPGGWAEACCTMSQIWVPAAASRSAFARSGVSADKVFVIPHVLDVERFRPGLVPLSVAGYRRAQFISVFEWQHRKGWDVLLRAYFAAFTAEDDVSLLIKTSASGEEPIRKLAEELTSGRSAPLILLDTDCVPAEIMPRLYATSNCFVLPFRGEGFGLPIAEAMASGLPVVVTDWGGPKDFVDGNVAYPIRVMGQAAPDDGFCRATGADPSHRWVEPDADHLVALLRHVAEHPEEAHQKGEAARQRVVDRLSPGSIADAISQRLETLTHDHGAARAGRQPLRKEPLRKEPHRRADDAEPAGPIRKPSLMQNAQRPAFASAIESSPPGAGAPTRRPISSQNANARTRRPVNLDVAIPVCRPGYIETVLASFERAGCDNIRVFLLSNDFESVRTYPFPVGMVRFHSASRYYGPNAFAATYNIGSWLSYQDHWANHFLWWDDDQIAPKGLFDAVREKLSAAPAVYGNYRMVDFNRYSPEELTDAPVDIGTSREEAPNRNHYFFSAFSGLAAFDTAFYWDVGGLDAIYDGERGGFDQQLGRRVAQAMGTDESVYIHEPPFAWHPTVETRVPSITPRTNGCFRKHELYQACHLFQGTHIPILRCANCHYHRLEEPLRTRLAAEVPGLIMPFEPERWDMEVTWNQ